MIDINKIQNMMEDLERGIFPPIDALIDAMKILLCEPEIYRVEGSRAELKPYMSIPHISIVNLQRALRWHPEGLNSWTPSDWACALAGEVGELCNVVKKMNRVRDGLQQRAVDNASLLEALEGEIGDVFAYLDLICHLHGLALEECVRKKFNAISEREGFPERL